MNSIKNTRLGTESAPESFNKSQRIILGLISKNKDMERLIYSYDNTYGIYRNCAKVLFSEKTPQCVINYYRDLDDTDPAQALAIDLVAKGIFTPSRLASIKACNDGSFFDYVKVSSIRRVIDVYNKLKNMETINLEDSVAQKSEVTWVQRLSKNEFLVAENKHRKFENRDLLEQIISDASLKSEFQLFIVDHLRKEYTTAEIVELYSQKKHTSYTMNYGSAQKSIAWAKLIKAAQKYIQEKEITI